MDNQKLIRSRNGIPDTHYFIYKNKKFPIKFDFFKYSSKYFLENQKLLENSKEIQLVDKEDEDNLHFSDDSIQNFIKFVQNQDVFLSNENVIDINYLSKKYEVLDLIEATNEYISSHQQELILPIFSIHQNDTSFETSTYEDILSTNLIQYINDELLLDLDVSILNRILTKYQLKNSKDKNIEKNKLIIDFLFKCLDKHGRKASVLFSNVDFGELRNKYVNRLITDYSQNFDFYFINPSLVKTLYKTNSELLQKTEKYQIEHEKSLLLMRSEIDQIKTELSMQRVEQAQKDKEHSDEIKRLNEEIEKLKAENAKQSEEQRRKEEELKKLKDENDRLEKLKQQEKQRGVSLRHSERGDFNGIIKYLTDQTRGNLHQNGTVNVTTNCKSTCGKLEGILDFNENYHYHLQPIDSWICLDFKNKKVRIENYSIKTNKDAINSGHLKSWKIEVSNDGSSWYDIDNRVNCSTLNGSRLTGTFSATHNEYSRFVRIHQTGQTWCGSDDSWFYYIEFYGYLLE